MTIDTIPKLYCSGFAFILMDDPRDAEDAVKELDGTRMCGRRVKVCFLTYKIDFISICNKNREKLENNIGQCVRDPDNVIKIYLK